MTGRRGRRILMTADAVGGVWQYALDLSAVLCGGGDAVTIALLGPPPAADQRRQADGIEGLRLIESDAVLDWLADGAEPVERGARAIAELARDEGADVVHCNTPALGGAADFPAPVVAVAHGCVATWWQAARGEPLAQSFHWHRAMMRRGLLAADAVVTPSAAFAEDVQRAYSLPMPPLVVHNGRRPLAPAASADGPLDAALTVCRLWDEAKGVPVLDRAAGLIGAPFLAAGPLVGPHGEAATLTNLQALGSLDEARLAALLARRPVFVSAARFEPFGLAVLEAAMAGCPLVLSDIATFRELWDGAALFVAAEDAAGFARAIEELLSDDCRRRELGAAAERRAARYTPEACAAAMDGIYDRLLCARRAAA